MGANYFTPENAWRHLFFIHGCTADEFYTDGGLKLNIEQLTQLELKRSGYERVVFYDKDQKLYCYDDESFALLRGRSGAGKESAPAPESAAPTHRKGGLKRGKLGKKAAASAEPVQPVEAEAVPDQPEQTDGTWTPGAASGIGIRRMGDGSLHLGMVDNTFVKRQIDAYMYDASIKTAVVINDPDDFLREFGDDPMHALTAGYERMGTENQNIMVFLYTDERLGNVYQVAQFDPQGKNVNDIQIGCPNVAELRNLLTYLRVRHGLRMSLRDLTPNVLALRQAMSLSEQEVRIKDLYTRLRAFGDRQPLTPAACYELVGVKQPTSAKEQLASLIGMQSLKDALAQFDTGDADQAGALAYLTASRLQPDLPHPKPKEEMIHFLLTGNPGTGKNTTAYLIGQLFYEMGYLETGHVVETDRSQLVSNHVGESALWTRQKVQEAMGGVLFIDEAYTLKRNRDSGNDFGQEVIDTLVKLMDQYKGKFILVAAGYPREMELFEKSNPGLAGRFRHLHISDYTPAEMEQIVAFHTRKNNAVLSDELQAALPNFCENWVNLAGTEWNNAREAVNLLDEMLRNWKQDPEAQSVTDETGVTHALLEPRHIPEALSGNLKPVAEMQAEALNRLNSLTGLNGVKATVERLRRRMLAGDQKEPGHYLFTGNSGTGKTTVARYMGQILRNLGMLKRGHLVEFTASELMSQMFNEEHHGDFYETVKHAMDGVLFIDEAYQLTTDTTGRGRPILDALLPFMENNRNHLCVIVAGYEDEMDDFLKYNSGFQSRFTESVHFDNYSGAQLQAILLAMLEEKGIQADADYQEYALRALTRYVEIHGKEKSFGNARYVRTEFLPDSLDAQTDRLIRQYGEDFPRELKQQLTGADIPAELVRFTKQPLPQPDTRTAAEKLDDLVGYEPIKAELRKLLKAKRSAQAEELGVVRMPERLHWVLEGNPGTGKTMIAKLIGQVYRECGILPKGHTNKVTRSNLVGEYMGQTAQKTRREIDRAMGGVLFIDEAYTLTKVEGNGSGYGQEAIGELVEAMEDYKGEFAVICAGYPDDMEDFLKANAGLASRMKKFVLEDYTPAELAKIFRHMCQEQKAELTPSLDEKLEQLFANQKQRESKLRDWGNGREVENLLREMLHEWEDHPEFRETEDGKKILLTEEHVPKKFTRYLKGTPQTAEKPRSAMEEIQQLIGFDEVKGELEDLLSLGQISARPEMEDLMDDLNFHWVLRGNPGTGKTTVAKLIGKVYKEIGLLSRGHTVKVTRADLVAEYVGQTAVKTKRCIDRAMGGVLFIDEAYTLKRGGSGGDDFGQEAIDTLLEQMSDRNGEFAVIAAGYPKPMKAFLDSNPGFESRFEKDFLLRDYTAKELCQIFLQKCQKKRFVLAEDLQEVLELLFENMIDARIKNWANGREAEKLEVQMRKLWARDPELLDGQRVYALRHLPEQYLSYLSDEGEEDEESAAPSPKQAKASFTLSADKLAQPEGAGNWEDRYLNQVASVVYIRAQNEGGVSSGSGSILTKDGYILTCNHVIEGSSSILVRLKVDNGQKTLWNPADVVWSDKELDAAILKMEDGEYPTLPLRPLSQPTQTGESIYHWGYPFGGKLSDDLNELQPSLFQGYISSTQIKNGLERINTNMEAKKGCSGGPVFSKKDGAIIGILCGSQTSGDEHFLEEINYVLPVKYIWERVVTHTETEQEKGDNA